MCILDVVNEEPATRNAANNDLSKKNKPSSIKPIFAGICLSFIPLMIIPFLDLLKEDTITREMLLTFLTEIFCKFEIIFIGVSRASTLLSEETNKKTKQHFYKILLMILAVFGTAVYTAILIKDISPTNNILRFNIFFIIAVLFIEFLFRKSLSKERGE